MEHGRHQGDTGQGDTPEEWPPSLGGPPVPPGRGGAGLERGVPATVAGLVSSILLFLPLWMLIAQNISYWLLIHFKMAFSGEFVETFLVLFIQCVLGCLLLKHARRFAIGWLIGSSIATTIWGLGLFLRHDVTG